MRKILSLCFCCCIVATMFAIPAKRNVFTHRQSDGTKLSLMLVGDEFMHFCVNTVTNEKMLLGADGDYHVATEAKFAELSKRASARRLSANKTRMQRLPARRNNVVNANGQRRVGTTSGTMTGSKKGLVILVNFSDKTFASAHTQSVLNNQFNQEGYSDGGHLGSVHDYFYDQSYGNFDLTFDVIGPVTVSQKMSYYGGNTDAGEDAHPAEMTIEACNLADAAGVNFADYDWDGDGEVDQVFIIYAGYGEAYGADDDTIWPHEWDLTSAEEYDDGTGALTLDNVKIDTYACSCELSGTSGTTLNGIGTACHEFSHCLGYPDLYDTDYSGGFGMYGWDLMCSGSYNGPNDNGEVPAGFTSYERWCAGWLTPKELSAAATITGMKPLGDSPDAYIIYNDKNADEYILLENRQNEKWFKYVRTYTTPHGLLAIHVDYDETAWNENVPNDDPSHQRMCIIPASGTYGTLKTNTSYASYTCTQSQAEGHPFGGSSKYTALTGTSNANSGGKWFTACSTGKTTFNHEVTEITNTSDGNISFLFDGGEVVDDGNRYTITYNAGTGTCGTASWTQTDFRETTTLPEASSPSADWTFFGWATDNIAETSACPTVMKSGTTYTPTADVTLYAVYQKSESGEISSYTLDYDSETALQSTTLGYGNAVSYTATDGSTWVVKAYKNEGMQINKGKNASIKVPECPGNISSIEVKDNKAKTLSFSSTDYNGSNSPTAVATSTASKTAELDLTDAELNTGYIYTTDGATVITKIVVNFGASTYCTSPSSEPGALYTVTFNAGTGSCSTASLSETSSHGGIVLPTAVAVSDEWTFAGWTTTLVEETNQMPATLLKAGSTYKPSEDITLYAVYQKSGTENTTCYKYTTTLTAGETYLFVSANTAGSAYVLDTENLSETGSQTVAGTEVTITMLGETPVIDEETHTAEWTAAGSATALQLMNGSYYLCINGLGMALTNSSKNVYWDSESGLYGKNSKGTKNYYVQSSGSNLTSSSTSGSSTNRVYMFKKDEQADVTYATCPEGSGLAGDINGDDAVDIADVKALVSILMCHTDSDWNLDAADVNGDGKTDIADVAALIQKLK